MISEVSLPDNGIWKNEVFKHWKITENARHRKYVLDNCFQHLSDILGKDKNKRLYIGPGRDGSSEDKISVDCKFESRTTKVQHISKALKSQDYVKASFIFDNDEWTLVEDQVDLDTDTPFTQKVSRMAIIIHPMFSTADEDAKADAGSGAATANLAIDPELHFKEDDSGCYFGNAFPVPVQHKVADNTSQRNPIDGRILLAKELRALEGSATQTDLDMLPSQAISPIGIGDILAPQSRHYNIGMFTHGDNNIVSRRCSL